MKMEIKKAFGHEAFICGHQRRKTVNNVDPITRVMFELAKSQSDKHRLHFYHNAIFIIMF